MKTTTTKKTSRGGNNLETTLVNNLIKSKADSHYYLVNRISHLMVMMEIYKAPANEIFFRTFYHFPKETETLIKKLDTLSPKDLVDYKNWQKQINQERPILDLMKNSHRKRFNEYLEYVFEFIENHKTSKDHSLRDLGLACLVVGRFLYKNIPTHEAARFLHTEEILRDIAHETIGYWTAKLEQKITNHENTKTKTTKSNSISDAIAALLEKHKITNMRVDFRSNKNLREEFMKDCREATRKFDTSTEDPSKQIPLSDERIKKKAREVLESRQLNAAKTGKTSV